jgi:hypothetical protein
MFSNSQPYTQDLAIVRDVVPTTPNCGADDTALPARLNISMPKSTKK